MKSVSGNIWLAAVICVLASVSLSGWVYNYKLQKELKDLRNAVRGLAVVYPKIYQVNLRGELVEMQKQNLSEGQMRERLGILEGNKLNQKVSSVVQRGGIVLDSGSVVAGGEAIRLKE